MTETTDKDYALWETWNRTKNPADLEKLVKQLDPLIQSEVNKRAGTLSRATLVTQAQVLTVKALKSFKPSVGVKVSTHVTNQIQKLSRVNYAHQNAARIPEHSMLQFHSVNVAKEDFESDHGREPSQAELADVLHWSPKKLEQFQTQFSRPELLESLEAPTAMFTPHQHDPRLEYAYSSLSPRQQAIFDHVTGHGGVEKLSNSQIMTRLKITQGILSYEKTKIKNAMQGLA